MPRDEQPRPPVAAEQAEKYWLVKFGAQSSPNDTKDVMLSVNGETLIIAREKPVVLPARYLECADATIFTQFKQIPGMSRKISTTIKVYPYDRMREATEREFVEQRDSGSKKLKADIARYGYDVQPEQLGD